MKLAWAVIIHSSGLENMGEERTLTESLGSSV